ncbi:DNA polymerase III subunit gamma/tau [Sandarakinorhabdus sp.]|uniref:DNA polymerase III subunit gamma/tau n=1 Tax=Sandarakinorhabdus sp. TaxID=1916663 RepID=UPI00286E2BB9|nr:DNA polymerase III subunit gamma/tau [Sandarakinorhabdus sp.]
MSDEMDFALPGMEPPTAGPTAGPAAYRVLARKYRPASFDTLLGQEAMVQTLGNAIARGRLAQAWLLTGVRGVGKTSTARIIAKALNCVGADGQGGPTISPCGVCEPCISIAAGQHIDVIEMDAASNTGVDDVREIIEGVRYASVSARYKIHIIDEVHMLSKAAFNALLKTLEEPPPNVKFILATTEVAKVPLTVLSRCQRFDLRRVPADTLTAHFADIAVREGVEAETDALALIARAAEGSVRDGLSMLDQAIAHAGGGVTAAAVREMLGLADRGMVRALLGKALAGDAPAALAMISEQYDLGLDPENLLRALLELVHGITRYRIAPRPDLSLSAEEQAEFAGWAQHLSFPRLHSLWQLLLKGLGEVQSAPVPLQAAEMALLRLIHAADMPDPGTLIRQLREGGMAQSAPAAAPAAAPEAAEPQASTPASVPAPATALEAVSVPTGLAEVAALFRARNEARLAHVLTDEARLVAFAPGAMTLAGTVSKEHQLAIARYLSDWTGQTWQIDWQANGGVATLHEQGRAAAAATLAAMREDPLARALIDSFPGAEIEPRNSHAQS